MRYSWFLAFAFLNVILFSPFGTTETEANSERSPAIATDGKGLWIAVWHSTAPDEKHNPKIDDICLAKSTDDGATWSQPQVIVTSELYVIWRNACPDIATDGRGQWLLVWYAQSGSGRVGQEHACLRASHSQDNGMTWSDPITIDQPKPTKWYGLKMFAPRLAFDPAGHWFVTWIRDSPAETDSPQYGCNAGHVYAASRSDDGGNTWTQLVTLGDFAETERGQFVAPQPVLGLDSQWLACWPSRKQRLNKDEQCPNVDVFLAQSSDAGDTWTKARLLKPDVEYQKPEGSEVSPGESEEVNGVDIATNGAGACVAVWDSIQAGLGEFMAGDSWVKWSRSTDNGKTWTKSYVLVTCPAKAHAEILNPILTYANNQWIAVWSSDDSRDGLFGTDYDLFLSSSKDNGESWSAPAPLNSNATKDWGDDKEPAMAADGKGNWVAVWSSDDSLGKTLSHSVSHIFVARSSDALTWSSPAALNPCAAQQTPYRRTKGNNGAPALTTDNKGNWLCIWQSNDDLDETIGKDSDIFVARSLLS